jgi:hypothetical protein
MPVNHSSVHFVTVLFSDISFLATGVLIRVVQVLEKTTGHARTFAWSFSFLAVSLPGGFSALGGKVPGMAGRLTGS